MLMFQQRCFGHPIGDLDQQASAGGGGVFLANGRCGNVLAAHYLQIQRARQMLVGHQILRQIAFSDKFLQIKLHCGACDAFGIGGVTRPVTLLKTIRMQTQAKSLDKLLIDMRRKINFNVVVVSPAFASASVLLVRRVCATLFGHLRQPPLPACVPSYRPSFFGFTQHYTSYHPWV